MTPLHSFLERLGVIYVESQTLGNPTVIVEALDVVRQFAEDNHYMHHEYDTRVGKGTRMVIYLKEGETHGEVIHSS